MSALLFHPSDHIYGTWVASDGRWAIHQIHDDLWALTSGEREVFHGFSLNECITEARRRSGERKRTCPSCGWVSETRGLCGSCGGDVA
jgi:hypothetical protein